MTQLFSRRTDTKRAKHSAATHCRAFAHRLLDRAQAGHEVSDADITWALRMTGDLSTYMATATLVKRAEELEAIA